MRFEAVVEDIISRTYNVKSFRFPRPTDYTYKAGQFMMITIKSRENKLKKPFSISSSPTEKDFIEFTKKLTGHDFSNALDSLNIGDWTEIEGPFGNLTFEGEYKKIGMLSGGIGITPLRSICKYCTDMRSDTNIILIYGNRTERDIVFREDLVQMQKQNRNLRVVFILDEPSKEWKSVTGIISADMIKKEVPDYAHRTFYTCGPPGMIQAMTNLLKSLEIPEKQIKTENFAGY